MKSLVFCSLAIVALQPSAAAGKEAPSTIRVSAPLSVEDWSRSLGSQVDRQLSRKLRILAGQNTFRTGFVSVRFRADHLGRPSAIEVVRRSGSRLLDDVAVRSIRAVDMNGLPHGIKAAQSYRANFIVSSDAKEISRFQAEIAQAAATRTLADAVQDADVVLRVVHRSS